MTTEDTASNIPNKQGSSALQMGPRKKASTSDPLVSHGRHFGRTVFALCNYSSLLTNGILRLEQMEDTPLEHFSSEEWREHRVFEQLLDSYPGLLERLKNGSEEDILHIRELVHRSLHGWKAKTLKSTVLDWISPKGEAIQPFLHRNSKIDCGFNHELTGSLLCPAGLDWNDSQTKENLRSGEMLVCGDQWPIFVYTHQTYDPDDPWCGLLRSHLLVSAYKHVFTSPSSVEKEPKATRSRNARLHSMNSVTIASLAYITTQVQLHHTFFRSSSVFSRTDTATDSETFYHSLLDLLEDPDESREVDELLMWWNRQVFPTSATAKRPITANSALSKIQQKCLALKQMSNPNIVSS
ncbi:uncharacterized protein F5147DRAFT_563507 [Suillus discolor]|uniref:Uncharacterized protein n=1 Tax=Suillus discolor TaxID=1912936 RepID=A0A9P7FJC3_9AGAM|nr:uncharacterized protein F5147DRAFT_563507 [Suillus discolor]KAG2120555.1 hypothetical protein F5147DRAFT_563507 [Suillus discolor]